MKILVTGAEGQLARSLVEAARGTAITVVALGRPSLDLTMPDRIAAHMREVVPNLVVNAAAYTAVDKAESEPDLAHSVNALGAGHVAAACRKGRIPIIHISTDYVFDGNKQAPYVESDDTAPAGAYGRSKLDGEINVQAQQPQHIILRTAWVHSPFGNNFVKTMLRLAETRTELGVVDDQLGTPTYAPHLAAAILDIARLIATRARDDMPWGIYHAAGQGEVTWCGLARATLARAAALGANPVKVNAITTADYPTPARRPANSRLDCTKLKKQLGIALPEWRLGVDECVARLMASKSG